MTPVQHAPQSPEKTSVASIWSLVLGILSFCLGFLVAIPGLICGIVAIVKINGSEGRLGGRGLAIGGIVTSCIGMLFGTAMLASLAMPVYSSLASSVANKETMVNLQAIRGALDNYRIDHNEFPDSLAALAPKYIEAEYLVDHNGEPYHYIRPDLTPSRPLDEIVVIYSRRASERRGRIVGFMDGHVERLTEEEFRAKVGE